MSAAPSAPAVDVATPFKGAQILVTGGFGLIGSALVRRLVAAGLRVRVLDNLDPDSGANRANLEGLEDRIEAVIGDLRDPDAVRRALPGCDVLFNLAAQTSHLGSMQAPLADLDVNARAQLALLEIARAVNPGLRIVFASTRQIYGKPDYLPVDERHPLRPVDVNGIDKLAGEAFHLLYHRVHGLRTTALRLTNTYGPGMRIRDARQTFVGVWLRAVLEGRPFDVWGGEQKRDFTYVDDAVDAFLLAAAMPETVGGVYNIGGDGALTLKKLAEALVAANGGGRFVMKEFPPERKAIDIGDYWADDTAFRRVAGWQPQIGISSGLEKSLDFFRTRLAKYV
ncbi:MAG TPA: NAD-dependent epimerase/dehydratase family protein [Stellaceae bacterium]|nr:NAD-dependent epimerase/dehydratase family protein [Stellaceae bacterium]